MSDLAAARRQTEEALNHASGCGSPSCPVCHENTESALRALYDATDKAESALAKAEESADTRVLVWEKAYHKMKGEKYAAESSLAAAERARYEAVEEAAARYKENVALYTRLAAAERQRDEAVGALRPFVEFWAAKRGMQFTPKEGPWTSVGTHGREYHLTVEACESAAAVLARIAGEGRR